MWTSGNLTLGQSCVHDTQCTGTEYVGTCIEGVCFCNEGYDLYQLQCLPGMYAFTILFQSNNLEIIFFLGFLSSLTCSLLQILIKNSEIVISYTCLWLKQFNLCVT